MENKEKRGDSCNTLGSSQNNESKAKKKFQRRGIMLVLAAIALLFALSFATLLPNTLAQEQGGTGGGGANPDSPVTPAQTPAPVVQVWDGSIAPFAGGNGTAQHPYLISNGSQLAFLAMITNNNIRNTRNLHFALTNNIYLNDIANYQNWSPTAGTTGGVAPANVWIPIGTVTPFRGNFDGRGFSVRGLYISTAATINVGLFGHVSTSAIITDEMLSIRNLTLSHSFIHAHGTFSFMGGIVGQVTAHRNQAPNATQMRDMMGMTFENVRNYANIVSTSTANNMEIGGIVGRVNLSVAANPVDPLDPSMELNFINTVNNGNIIAGNGGTGRLTGGLVGRINRAGAGFTRPIDSPCTVINIIDSANNGNITQDQLGGASSDMGGFIGHFSTVDATVDIALNIDSSANNGNLTMVDNAATRRVGGFVGWFNMPASNRRAAYVNITSSVNTGDITVAGTSSLYGGGFFGEHRGDTAAVHDFTRLDISGSRNEGNISVSGTSALFAGGFIGDNFASASVNSRLNIVNSHNEGTVSIPQGTSSIHIGGLIGRNHAHRHVNYQANLINVANHGDIHVSVTSSTINVGGLIGNNENVANNHIVIMNSYNDGDIGVSSTSTTLHVGGIMGIAMNTAQVHLINTHNEGAISANTNSIIRIGGLIGRTEATITNIINSHNDGNINSGTLGGDQGGGGLVGRLGNTSGATLNILNSRNSARVALNGTTNIRVGGLVGEQARVANANPAAVNIRNSINSGEIRGESNITAQGPHVGGLIGSIYAYGGAASGTQIQGHLTNNLSSGALFASSPAAQGGNRRGVGGIVGMIWTGTTASNNTIRNNVISANISGTNVNHGAIVGNAIVSQGITLHLNQNYILRTAAINPAHVPFLGVGTTATPNLAQNRVFLSGGLLRNEANNADEALTVAGLTHGNILPALNADVLALNNASTSHTYSGWTLVDGLPHLHQGGNWTIPERPDPTPPTGASHTIQFNMTAPAFASFYEEFMDEAEDFYVELGANQNFIIPTLETELFGWTFIGWGGAPFNGSAQNAHIAHRVGETVRGLGQYDGAVINLYPLFEAREINIDLDLQGGRFRDGAARTNRIRARFDHQTNDAAIVPPIRVAQGALGTRVYSFRGFRTGRGGTGTLYINAVGQAAREETVNSQTVVMPGNAWISGLDDTTLYADWALQSEITFSETAVMGAPITIAVPFASSHDNRRVVSEFMTIDTTRHIPIVTGGNPFRADQTFIRWEGLETHTEIIGRQRFEPVFAANPSLHTVTFMIDGVPHVRQAYAGQTMSFLMAGLPGFGNRGQYTPDGFLGWSGPFSRLVAGNVTLTANFLAGGFASLAAADVVCESELGAVDFSEVSMMGMFALDCFDYFVQEEVARSRVVASEASIMSDGYDVGEDCEAMGEEVSPPCPAYQMGVTAVSAAPVSGGLGNVSISFRFFNENYGGMFEVVFAQGGMIQPGAFLAQVAQPPIFNQSDIAFDGPVHGPLKAGYRFVRWSGLEFFDVISGHHVFYAVFMAEPVQMFSVGFDFYRADGLTSFTTNAPSGSYVSWALEGGLFDSHARAEYVFLGWEFSEGGNWLPVPRGMVVTRNLQLRAVYIHEDDLANLDEWTVRFLDGDRVIAVVQVLDGMLIGSLNIPVNPTRAASSLSTYQFDAWLFEGAEFNFNSPIGASIDLIARFIASPRYFAVRFVDHNGDEVRAAASYRFGHELAMSYAPSAPVREGFVFIRWDGFLGNPFVVTSDHTFIAVFSPLHPPVDTFTIRFIRFGQPDLVINNVLRGTLVSSLFPIAPIRPGHDFLGWEGYSVGMVVNANHVFTADFRAIQTPAVYFEITVQNRNGGISFIKTVLEGTLISEILPSAPFYAGYTFIRWEMQNGASFVQIAHGRRVYGNYTFRPIYESSFVGIDRFIVSFYVESGVLFERHFDVLDGSIVVFPTTMPYLAGHTVTWELMLLNGDKIAASPDTLVYRNLSFYARFIDPLASPFQITIGSNMSIEGNLTQALVGTVVAVNTFAPLNQRLVGFNSTPSVIFSGSGNTRTFVMPASDISITAIFEYIYHNISVINGTTNINQARQGDSVSVILGFAPPANQMFASISIVPFIGHTITGTGNVMTVSFYMPTQDVIISINFDIFFIVNVTEHGSASPAIAIADTAVAITFNSRPGFNLIGYTANIVLSGTGYNRNFVMPSHNVTITPIFEAIPFNITTNAMPASGGTINANLASATVGQTVLLNLTVNAGYFFNPLSGFISTPNVLITPTAIENQFSFVMPASNVSITANFSADEFDITVNTVGNGTVTMSPNVTSATMGTVITLIATAALGSQFNGFNASGIVFTNVGAHQYTFVMPANAVIITANFGLIQYTISTVLTPNSGGNINILGSITTASMGTAVYFNVVTNALYEFDGLSALNITGGAAITQTAANTFRFIMPASNVTISANFVRIFNITVNAPNGTLNRLTQRAGQPVILTIGTIPLNHTLSITSTPVVAFSGAGGSGSTRTFIMPTADVAIIVTFIAPDQHAITTNTNLVLGGSIINLSALSAISGTNISFDISTNTGFNFENITIYAGLTPVVFSGNAAIGFSFVMPDASVIITANFSAIPFSITALAATGGSISNISALNATAGTTVTFVAAPNAGFERTSVSVMMGAVAVGVVLGTNAHEFSFTMPAGNVTISAEFIAVASAITINVLPGTGGSVLSSHTNAIAGTIVILTVNASALYQFDGFVASGVAINQIGSTNQFQFVMSIEAVSIEANFVRVFNITIGGDIGGTLNITGAQRAGTNIIATLAALPIGHEYLINIVSPVSLTYSLTGNQLSFTMPSDNVVININSQVQTFRVEFSNDGIVYYIDGVEHGTPISALNFVTARANLVYNDALVFFTGWNLLNHGLMPSWPNTVVQNLTFQANFSSIMPTQDEANISFYVDGNQIFSQTVYIDLGTSRLLVVSRPSNPINWSNNRYNFVFDRWVDQNGIDWSDDRLIEGDLVFDAVFISSVREFDVRFEYLTAANTVTFIIITLSHDTLIYGHASIPHPPLRANYTFVGWQGLNEWTRVTGNMTFIASYVYSGTAATQHRVIFLNYDSTVEVFNQLVLEGTIVSSIKPLAPNRIGFTFVGWLNYVPNMQVTSDLIFVATYIENAVSINNATVVFYMIDGISEIELARFENIIVGTLINSLNIPTAPTRAGYTFVRWQGLQANSMATPGLQAFRAIYIANIEVQTFTVTFVNYDSTPIASVSAVFGTYISWLLPANPSRVDASYVWIFEGWELHLGGANWAVLSNQTVVSNHTLRAYFLEYADMFSITWLNYDGTTYRIDPIREHRLIANIPVVIKNPSIQETFNFVGWFIYGTDTAWNFASDRISGYLVLEARFIGQPRQYTINFVVGTTVVSSISLAFGDAIWPSALAVGAPTAPIGYVFSYWRGLVPSMSVVGNHNFFAVFRPIDATIYTIRFLNNNAVVLQHNLAAGVLIANHLPSIPVRAGYTFLGWSGLTGGMVVTGHHDFEAAWAAIIDPGNPQVFILRFFDEDGITLVLEMTDIAYGTLISQILPAGLIRASKEFVRWDKIGASNLINGASRIEGNTDFIAVFMDTAIAQRFSIEFLMPALHGGAVVLRLENVLAGTYINSLVPTIPNVAGHNFVGWQGLNANMLVTSNHTFIAQFEARQLQITFNAALADSLEFSSKMVTFGTAFGVLPNADRAGHLFIGWFTAPNGMGTQIFASTIVAFVVNTTLHAAWSNQSVIVFDSNGGNQIERLEGAPNSAINPLDVEARVPFRLGHNFIGWFEAGATTAFAFNNMPHDMGNPVVLTLYARWGAIEFSVVYNINIPHANALHWGDMQDSYFNFGTSGTLRTNEFNVYGWTFVGWSTNPHALTPTYSDNAAVFNWANTQGAVVNIYAIWQANRHLVTFNYHGATGGAGLANTFVYFDSPYGVLPNPNRVGHLFVGWYTAQVGGVRIELATIVSNNAPHTLHARWEELQAHTITVVGYGTTNVLVAFAGDEISLVLNIPTGYMLISITTNPDITIIGTGANRTFVMPNQAVIITIEVQSIESIPFNITINGGTAVANAVLNTLVTVTFDAPAYGFMIAGFDTNPVGLVLTQISTSNIWTFYMPASDVVITPIIVPIDTATNSVTITNGAVLIPGNNLSANFVPGQVVTIRVNNPPMGLIFDDFTLVGISALAPGSNAGYWTFVMPDQAVIITVNWTEPDPSFPVEMTVTFVFNGADDYYTFAPNKQVTFGQIYGPLPQPSRHGFIFGGWQTVLGMPINSDTVVNHTINHILIAQWTPLVFNVTITNATGTGEYTFGTRVEISLLLLAGFEFVDFVNLVGIARADIHFDADLNVHWFIMPASNVEITASYVAINFALTINGGWATDEDGNTITTAVVGQRVILHYDAPMAGYEFRRFISNALVPVRFDGEYFYIIMPASNVTISVDVEEEGITTYWLNIFGATGVGRYAPNDMVFITLIPPLGQTVGDNIENYAIFEGITFQHLIPVPGQANTFFFVMPANDVRIDFRPAFILAPPPTFTITIDGGSYLVLNGNEEGYPIAGSIIRLTPDSAPYGYRFMRFDTRDVVIFVDADGFYFIMPAFNITLTAVFERLERFNIVWKNEDGSIIESTDAMSGTIIALPSDPVSPLPNRIFVRWDGFVPGMAVIANHVFIAIFESTLINYEYFVITWNYIDADGNAVYRQQSLRAGQVIAPPTNLPLRANYVFVAWQDFVSGMIVTGNHQFYAIYILSYPPPNRYVVTWLDSDGVTVLRRQQLTQGSEIIAQAAPVREGYVFSGWYGFVHGMRVIGNHEFRAIFVSDSDSEMSFSIEWHDADGNVILSQSLRQGVVIVAPAAPIVYGYVFILWQGFNPGMTAQSNHVFVAVFEADDPANPIPRFNITWIGYGGVTLMQITLIRGALIPLLPALNIADKIFIEWAGFSDGMTASYDHVFVAVFVPAFVTVIFDSAGGTGIYSQTVAFGTRLTEPSNPIRQGYIFVGWYIYGTETRWDFDSVVTGDMTLVAVWRRAGGATYENGLDLDGWVWWAVGGAGVGVLAMIIFLLVRKKRRD